MLTNRPKTFANRLKNSAALLLVAFALPATAGEALGPLPAAPQVNQDRAALGRLLFFDARLSGDAGVSCSTCHDPAKGWGDGQALSDGYPGVLYFRNAPGLFNVAGRNTFMWDARLDGKDLGTLVRDMLVEAHTMNLDSRLGQERLKQVPEYVAMFDKAYGSEPYGGKIYGAIGEYLKTIRTENAPFDKFQNGDENALDKAALRGLVLFTGKAGCAACHSGPMLSDGDVHATGVPDNPDLITATTDDAAQRQITLLRHYATQGVPNYMNLRSDVGNYVVTKDEGSIGKFATPSLWDVGQTGPYMHSGVYASLGDVVAFYNDGGGTGANKDARIKPLGLSSEEQTDLVAFLQSLTGDAPNVTVPQLPDYQLRQAGQN